MKKFLIFLVFSLPASAFAGWLDVTSKVDRLVTYAHNNTVLVYLSKTGSDVTACSNKTGFAISKTIEPEARARMYSMLLAAQASDRDVTVTYNDTGNCEPWDAGETVFRKIVRLR